MAMENCGSVIEGKVWLHCFAASCNVSLASKQHFCGLRADSSFVTFCLTRPWRNAHDNPIQCNGVHVHHMSTWRFEKSHASSSGFSFSPLSMSAVWSEKRFMCCIILWHHNSLRGTSIFSCTLYLVPCTIFVNFYSRMKPLLQWALELSYGYRSFASKFSFCERKPFWDLWKFDCILQGMMNSFTPDLQGNLTEAKRQGIDCFSDTSMRNWIALILLARITVIECYKVSSADLPFA